MQQEEQPPFNVKLPDGQEFDILTKNGVKDFLQAGSQSKQYLAGIVELMSKTSEKNLLLFQYLIFGTISQHSSQDDFRENVEQSTIRAFLKHVIEQIKRFSASQDWIDTGELSPHDQSLLEALVPMMDHAMPVSLAFECEFFNALADFVKARKGTGRALPSDEICDIMTTTVGNAYDTSREAFEIKWTAEKALTKLEATGVLEEFFRCATVPQPDDSKYPDLFRLLDECQVCLPFISKKFAREWRPCADVTLAILNEEDGSPVARPRVFKQLKALYRFGESIHLVQKGADGDRICHNCGKGSHSESFQKSLMRCSRCLETYYCSKECQKADWKLHKVRCVPISKEDLVEKQYMTQTLLDFCFRAYIHIMVKMIRACEETGLSKNDMVVELDFTANKDGIVQVMQDKPEFKIAPFKDYVEGSRPAEPDWFHKNADREVYERAMKWFIPAMKERHSKLQPNQLLFLVHYGGSFECSTITRPDSNTQKETFSPEAFLAFQKYINHAENEPLSEFFGPEYFSTLMYKLEIYYNLPNDAEIFMQDFMSSMMGAFSSTLR